LTLPFYACKISLFEIMILQGFPNSMSNDPNAQKKRSFVPRPSAPIQIDRRLVTLKGLDLSIEMNKKIKTEERRIRFENRLNLSGNAIASLVLKMKLERTDVWAQKLYEIYCDVWKIQGQIRTRRFIQSDCLQAVQSLIRTRTRVASQEFRRTANTGNLTGPLRDALMNSFKLKMRRLEGDWDRRLEIDARECEHAERIGRQGVDHSGGPSSASDSQNKNPKENGLIDNIGQGPTDALPSPSLPTNDLNGGGGGRAPIEDKLQLIIHKVQNPKHFRTLAVREAALYCEVQPATIYRWIANGKLASGTRRGTVTTESINVYEKKRSRKPRRKSEN
jgi:hypothetical protein